MYKHLFFATIIISLQASDLVAPLVTQQEITDLKNNIYNAERAKEAYCNETIDIGGLYAATNICLNSANKVFNCEKNNSLLSQKEKTTLFKKVDGLHKSYKRFKKLGRPNRKLLIFNTNI